MNKHTKRKSKILEAVYEAAKDLQEIGLIDKRKMRKYDLLCLPAIPEYSPKKIKALRSRHHLSQAVFASLLNIGLSTVRQWEIGDKHPSGPSLKLLNLLDIQGIEIFCGNPSVFLGQDNRGDNHH